MNKFIISLIIIAFVVIVQGCSKNDSMTNPTPTEPSFASDIQPIFNSNCVGCHVAGGAAGSYLILTSAGSFTNIFNKPSKQNSSYTLIVPFKPDSSLLYLKIATSNPPVGNRMPSGGAALNSNSIDAIRNWINNGAKNN